MPLSGSFWKPFFRDRCEKRIEYYVNTLETRMLPVYQNIEQEAEKISDDKWEEYMSMPSDGSLDPSDFVDSALDEGIEYFFIMAGQKQSLLNLSSTVLYHLVEQHLLLFHRNQLLMPFEEKDEKLISLNEFYKRSKICNVDIKNLPSWKFFDELRKINNVVKHAEGKSANELRQLRPDLFQSPTLKGMLTNSSTAYTWIYLPIAGEDLFLSLDDVKYYAEKLKSFIEEFVVAICSV